MEKKFNTLFEFAQKSSLRVGDGLEVGNFPFFTSSPILSKRVNNAQYYKNALIFGTGGSPNVHFSGEPFSTSADCIVAVPKTESINAKYVFYYLFGNIHILERGFKGAGLKHISKKYIEKINVPIFPLEIQNKIIAVLDKAFALNKKRELSLKLFEELLKATFLDLFGDPIVNHKNWVKSPLSDFGDIITGNTPPRKNPKFYNDNFIEWIKTDNIILESIYPTKASEYLSGEGALVGRIVDEGAVLVACIAGSLSSIGRSALVNRRIAFNQQINAIQPTPNISPLFLFYLIRNSSPFIQSFATKGMKKIITKGVFQKIQLINPPYELQLKFENYSIKLNESIFRIRKSKNDIDTLFHSLLQKVFNGELNFNIDFELDALVSEIDLQKKENDLSKIIIDEVYLHRLVDRLNNQAFNQRELYDKAKHVVFQLLKEDDKIVIEYDEKEKSTKLALK